MSEDTWLDNINAPVSLSLGKPQQVDAAKLLLYLRQECASHPEKPRSQLSTTTEGLPPLPLGWLLA